MNTEKTDFSPQDSFDMLQSIIVQTRVKYEENGLWIMIWGLAVMLAGISQFLLIKNGLGAKSGFAWLFTMVPLFIINMLVEYRKNKNRPEKKNKGIDITGGAWLMAGCMAMITGFIFGNKFGSTFTTAMFLPFCVAALVSGLSLRNKVFTLMSVISVGLAYSALFIPWQYHSLVAAGIAGVLFFIPGLILRKDYLKRQRV